MDVMDLLHYLSYHGRSCYCRTLGLLRLCAKPIIEIYQSDGDDDDDDDDDDDGRTHRR